MALVYLVSENCAPRWYRFDHINVVDSQLNSAMRLISGTIKSIALQWLPVLSNIAPPYLRRKAAADLLIA